MDREGPCHLDQIGSQLSDMTLSHWVSFPICTQRKYWVPWPQRNRKGGIETQRGNSFGVPGESGRGLCACIFFNGTGN